MLDEFSDYYADFLQGSYDCVDRIVLNAYFKLGQSPGGFRTWWRHLNGSDDDLDNAHLMRMAGRVSRRLRAHAKGHSSAGGTLVRLTTIRWGATKYPRLTKRFKTRQGS